MMRALVVVVVAVLAAVPARADIPLPAEPTARVTSTARLWAKVKFFHPYLAYKPIDWDAAFVAAIPKLEAATTPEAYRKVIADLVGKLGDPVTRVLGAPPPSVKPAPFAKPWVAPGVYAIQYAAVQGGFNFANVTQANERFITELGTAKVAIVDVRGVPYHVASFATMGLVRAMPAIERWPLQRNVEHRGYRTQAGQTSGGYASHFVTSGAEPATLAAKAGPSHVVFVLDAGSGVPALALALQAAGRATVVAPAPILEESVIATDEIELAAGVIVQVRLAELLGGAPKADAVVRTGDVNARVVQLAKAAIGRAGRPRPAIVRALPEYQPRNDNDSADKLYPTRELRMFAGIKLWMTLELFFPYRHLVTDWDDALARALPDLVAAADTAAYRDALRRLAVNTHDGHVWVYPGGPDPATKPRGTPPVEAMLVEGRLVVTRLLDASEAKTAGIAVGDVIESIDGKPAKTALAERRATVSGSTDEARDQSTARMLLSRDDGTKLVLGIRDAQQRARSVTLDVKKRADAPKSGPHWKLLPDNLGYVDLTTLVVPEVDQMFKDLASTRAIIFDLRGYPNGTAWAIAPRINVKQAAYGAQFLQPLVSGWENRRIQFLQPLAKAGALYRGKIVVMIDHRAISQSEHSCLFYKEAANATFVGSPTAGANGDVTVMRLPGGLRASFTGQEVRHVDGTQLQRRGIQPHVLVRPTIAGIRAGRDEVLERAKAVALTK